MEKVTLKIEKEVHKKLQQVKLDKDFKSLSETIDYLIKDKK